MRAAARAIGLIGMAASMLVIDAGRARPTVTAAEGGWLKAHVAGTREAGARLSRWLEGKRRWAAQRLATRSPDEDHIDYHLAIERRPISPTTAEEARVARSTKQLYDELFPPSDPASQVGTFLESANPWVATPAGGFQWDSLRTSGVDDPGAFDRAIAALTSLDIGFRSVRLGPNLFEIDPDRPETWSSFLDKIDALWGHDVTPTISVAFFPSLRRWQTRAPDGSIDHVRSHLLHPDFPSDLGRMTDGLMRGLWARAARFEAAHPGRRANVVINPINEPETLAAFNLQFWHGGWPGWASPESMRSYVPSVVAIAEAAVRVRLAVERASPRRVLFLHNEAMTPASYPSHRGSGRFAVSKLALGDDVLLAARLDDIPCRDPAALARRLGSAGRSEIDWALGEFVFGAWNGDDEARAAACEDLRARLQRLRRLHAQLRAETGKTMKTDTVLHLDYYCQTEFQLDRPIEALVAELSSERGAALQRMVGVASDRAFVAWLNRQLVETERRYPGVRLPRVGGRRRAEIDFPALLRAEDDALLMHLVGLRREYALHEDPLHRARQQRAGLLPQRRKLERTDALLARLSTSGGLRHVLGVSTEQAARAALEDAARDTRDGGPAVAIAEGEDLRALLARDGRRVLHRLLGLEVQTHLGFEPMHYARQIRLGLRRGLYALGHEYVDALRVHVIGVGESGTPYFAFAPLLHDQLMMEYAALAESGAYPTQYVLGPGVDTHGWALGPLSRPFVGADPDPSGILTLVGTASAPSFRGRAHRTHPKPWVQLFLEPLYRSWRDEPG